MSTSAHSFQSTKGYAIEKSQKGLPNPVELFKPDYTWQHAIDTRTPLFDGEAHWLDQTERAECSFFGDAENAEWASQVLSIAPGILNNTKPEDDNQKKMNRLLGRMAVLSRAAAELSIKRPRDDRLSTINNSFVDSYRWYHETIHKSQDPPTYLEQYVDTLMDKMTALATILAETSTASPEPSSIPPISLLPSFTSRPPTDTTSGDSSSSHPASYATDKGTDSGPRKDTERTSTPSDHACKSEGSGRLRRLFGKGSGRKGKDKEV